MKNTRLTKLLAVCLSLVLVIGAVALVAVFAEGSSESAVTDKVGIASVNLSFGDKHQLAYAVRADESYLAETNGRVGLLLPRSSTDPRRTEYSLTIRKRSAMRSFT